jgi:hypothetical protein
VKAGDDKQSLYALMAILEDDSSSIDVDSIITNKNITDPKTIELLINIAIAKKKVEKEGAISSSLK